MFVSASPEAYLDASLTRSVTSYPAVCSDWFLANSPSAASSSMLRFLPSSSDTPYSSSSLWAGGSLWMRTGACITAAQGQEAFSLRAPFLKGIFFIWQQQKIPWLHTRSPLGVGAPLVPFGFSVPQSYLLEGSQGSRPALCPPGLSS